MSEENKENMVEAAPSDGSSKNAKRGILEALILFIKGIVVGVANIIPGVSGGTIAVVAGIFDPLIEAINTLFKKFKKNIVNISIFFRSTCRYIKSILLSE